MTFQFEKMKKGASISQIIVAMAAGKIKEKYECSVPCVNGGKNFGPSKKKTIDKLFLVL